MYLRFHLCHFNGPSRSRSNWLIAPAPCVLSRGDWCLGRIERSEVAAIARSAQHSLRPFGCAFAAVTEAIAGDGRVGAEVTGQVGEQDQLQFAIGWEATRAYPSPCSTPLRRGGRRIPAGVPEAHRLADRARHGDVAGLHVKDASLPIA